MSNETQLAAYPSRSSKSDGDFPVVGVLLTTAMGLVIAIVLAIVTSAIGQFIYIPFVFSVLLGGSVGYALGHFVQVSRIRNEIVCATVGLICGLVTVGTLHYADYVIFTEVVESAESGILRRVFGPPDEQELVDAKSVDSLPSFLQYSATQGVEFYLLRAPQAGSIKLNYRNSFIYWALEALVVVGCTIAFPFMQASEPFCLGCQAWKKKRDLGSLNADPVGVEGIIESGRIDELAELDGTSDHTMISAYLCPECQFDGEADLFVVRMESASADAKRSEMLSRTVLPGEAAYQLMTWLGKA